MGMNMDRLPNWTINGTARSNGGDFNKVTIRGEADVAGDVTCNELKLMGTLKMSGNLRMKLSKIMGSADVDGHVHGDDINVMGELRIKGDCNAETFKSRGTFEIDGLLNAESVELRLYGPSRVREIGGESIQVKPHFRFLSGGFRKLTVDTIEGDDIRLEQTSARVVRGNRVDIGPGCDIDLVEYKTDFRQDDGAKVGQQTKV
ncbi:polymer-forming cytoskeletal protein [Alicyclobacillus dauci]|uniref:Polymer-forming cytoskeletal protein n=1 Tax=Alicyclobacillus dauci TaxID=1475485 RepID=A0ABY6Z3A3_9BACL|nr:polymer-forming cytoskeletal protein [Alicyclobacillus dauci]WAH37362.1 polymer-forming cytoskeletal protein [Alicyclobacillus dauci]